MPRDDGEIHRRHFQHDTARPVDGYAAPQLHTHAVIFNMTERENGFENRKQMRALQPHEMFVPALRHGRLPIRVGTASRKAGLRPGARQAWAAGNPRLLEGISGSFQSATRTDQRSSAGARDQRSRRQHRSRPIIRATARNCCLLKKSYSGTVSWPPSMGIRRTAWSLKRANTGSIGCKTRRCKRSGP